MEDDLCSSVLRGAECKNVNCGRMHSCEEFLRKKKDIGNICIHYDKYGYCRYGIRCMFASGHRDNNEVKDVEYDTRNVVGRDFLRSLARKRNEGKYKTDSYDVLDTSMCAKDKDVQVGHSEGSGSSEVHKLDFSGKLYLAPLTTVGNLPFRRICKEFGADVTCCEMVFTQKLVSGETSEWALLKKHKTEDIFGVQLCGSNPDITARCAEIICKNVEVDFIDINAACPIDIVYRKGHGSALMGHPKKIEKIIDKIREKTDKPITLKMRTGIYNNKNKAHEIVKFLDNKGLSAIAIHGRSREQRYKKEADWDYITECAKASQSTPIIGNGDVISFEDYYNKLESSGTKSILVSRGALIKPWIFTEIKERRNWDISSSERLEILKKFCNYGLEHFGSDIRGVDTTRRFLLEWLSFLHRYIPLRLLEYIPQKMNDRFPTTLVLRDDLEYLMSKSDVQSWIKLSEIYLGPAKPDFVFHPKHKSGYLLPDDE